MYKNVYAQRDRDNWGNFIMHLWDDSGYHTEDFQNYGYVECSRHQQEAVGVKGEPLKRVENWNIKATNMHYADHNLGNIHTKFLIDKYGNTDEVSTTHRELFFDIEIEMGGALTEEYIKKAPKPITSIAWWDKQLDEWGIVIVDKIGEIEAEKKGNKEIIPVKRESDLISIFLDRYEAIAPDILVGFNSDYFDIPYLYYRIHNQLGQRYSRRLSPIGRIESNRFWDPDQPVRIAGVSSLDYIRLHRKYSSKEEPSYKLDSLGEKYVGQKKIEYKGNLNILFKEDKQKFIEYNFMDVKILKLLDEKFKYIDLTKNLAHKGKVNYEEVYKSSRIHDGAISTYLLSQGIIPPNKDPDPLENTGYAGGYLFMPQTGIFPYLFDEDLEALYPTIIMSLNIGRETFVGRIILDEPDVDKLSEKDYEVKIKDNKYNNRLGLNDLKKLDQESYISVGKKYITKQMKIKDFIETIELNNLAISANGVIFRVDKQSTLSIVLEKWFNERREFKKLMKEAFKSGDKKLGEYYHLRQYTLKILLNSLYGATARPEFRYGTVILSSAITLTGHRIIQESALMANTHMNKVIRKEETIEI